MKDRVCFVLSDSKACKMIAHGYMTDRVCCILCDSKRCKIM